MISKMYQNTTRLIPNLADNIFYRDNKKGYSPLFGKMDGAIFKPESNKSKGEEIDSLKLSYVEKVIELAQTNGIQILFMVSPRYGGQSSIEKYHPAIELCKKHGVQVCDYINCSDIVNKDFYFQDAGHMNHEGAVVYTNLLVKEVLNNKYK